MKCPVVKAASKINIHNLKAIPSRKVSDESLGREETS